jgi:hypothetical protein
MRKVSYHRFVENEPSPLTVVDVISLDGGIGGYVKKECLFPLEKKYFRNNSANSNSRVDSVFTSILLPSYSTISHRAFVVMLFIESKSRDRNYFIASPYRRYRISVEPNTDKRLLSDFTGGHTFSEPKIDDCQIDKR